MSIETFDIIVIGLGAHGSSALYHLAKTGQKVLGIDRYMPPHEHGSSHGQSRIIRQAYHENPVYVPFVKAAYTLWEEIERETGEKLLTETGGLLLGAADSTVVTGARLSADKHAIEYDYLDAGEVRRRFPAFRPAEDTVAVWEKRAGILFPEECIRTHLKEAVANGVSVRCDETVLTINPQAGGRVVEVTTSRGRYMAEKVIVSAGAWVGALLPELRLPLTIERQVVCWFTDKANGSQLHPSGMPIYIWEYDPGRMFYGFPDLGEGIKIGFHHAGRRILPDELRPDASAEEIGALTDIAGRYLSIHPVFRRFSVCMYTNTSDEDFILDAYPGCERIFVASPCSGHGFKFSSVIGKILSEWACDRPTGFDLAPFSIARLGRGALLSWVK
jgi:sarcosine oxidase